MTNLFKESGTLPVPGLIGRLVRVAVGLLLLLLLGFILSNYQLGRPVMLGNELWWLGVACAIYLLPAASYVPFGYEPNKHIQIITATLVLVAGFVDLFQTGRFMGPTLAFVLMVLVVYVTSVGGLSYALAGIWAVPG